jgi:glycosyltransferase involved in cell wall biosynthesis
MSLHLLRDTPDMESNEPVPQPGVRRIGWLASHPIQYHAPVFRELARRCELTVFFAHRQTPAGQAAAGFGVPFEWDVDLLGGFQSVFLENRARDPGPHHLFGCNTPGIFKEIRRGRFDAFVVSGWNLLSYWQAVLACRRAGVPVIIRGESQLATPRGLVKRGLKRLIYPLLLSAFDAFLYIGTRNRDYLRHYGARPERLFFAPYCVDVGHFTSASRAVDRNAMRSSIGLQGGDRAIMFAGKLIEKKRPAQLIEAAALLRDRNFPVRPVFVGSGPLEGDINIRARALGIAPIMLGFRNQTELPALYAAADVLVLPSDGAETWGLVVNEAFACGLPAVVSDAVGCGPDLVEEGLTGAVFPLDDVEELASAVERALRLDRASVQRQLASKSAAYIPARTAEAALAATTALSRS